LWGLFNEDFALAVKVNSNGGYYEGYIFEVYESIDSGGFKQTLRGVYKSGTSLTVTSNEKEKSFSVNGDTWVLSENDDSFYLLR